MAIHIVTYDLNSPGKDYATLLAEIRKYTHCHCLKSAFFIDTQEQANTVRDKLTKFVDANDQLYVLTLNGMWAGTRNDNCTAWLQSPQRNWK